VSKSVYNQDTGVSQAGHFGRYYFNYPARYFNEYHIGAALAAAPRYRNPLA